MKLFKYCIPLFVLIGLLALVPTASAASQEANDAADVLNSLGLFAGTGTDEYNNPKYDLDRTPTRAEAVTMLVRLLGKEAEAKAGNWNIPFKDVADWAKPYVGYAYANGLTSGTSATTFSGNANISATQYLTFILRALGYDSSKDFQWDKAWELTDQLGITDGQYNANSKFERSNVVLVSKAVLNAKVVSTGKTLLEQLKDDGAVKADAELELKTVELVDYRTGKLDDGINSVTAKKIGDNYRFDISFTPNTFAQVSFFPAGLQKSNGFDGLRFIISEKGTSHISFSVSHKYIFENPINRELATIQFWNKTENSYKVIAFRTKYLIEEKNWTNEMAPISATILEGEWSPSNVSTDAIKSIRVEKIGNDYKFYISLDPNVIVWVSVVPTATGSPGTENMEMQRYEYREFFGSSGHISFSIPQDYIYHNPVRELLGSASGEGMYIVFGIKDKIEYTLRYSFSSSSLPQ